ncbi:prephenate dehydrogenase/arogenate dehydrogenase family protein [Glycomyces sp. TRM65418]|uniref:prephenate dehydrogenase n=1 Tax=Glycomyces sp. TRM65418 TaxID=2867006 RepID=UPI001CE648E7|nr:prephenate dehydrogenase/arogenate dehydrogenase family protein [Glycomyces sp. TRM65418]MCC3763878.1 prephenate dehydrogenase/arogenate dehydrogenase family protein [Glycomyces sp. TRM65418]QZD53581.1 prephenate dehydrogenase/arogenate dehydrogenase family protein [Glycomyces sp. TRM65418]
MRVAVLGLGLIGGSVALALHEAGHTVLGHDPDPAAREAAAAHVPVTADPAALLDTDVAVVAAPYRHLAAIAAETLPADRYTGLITDVASVKVDAALAFAAHRRFVGGHPMAGKETAGFASAEPGLFRDRPWVLCLEADTDLEDWAALARLWTAVGARVVPATAEAHDVAAARISHLEHLVAAALVNVADDPLSRTLAAGSYRDGTRVAASPTALFAGMVEGNGTQLLSALDELIEELCSARLRLSEHAQRPEAVAAWFDHARARRAAWPPEAGGAERIPLTREALVELGAAGGWVEALEDEVALARRPRVQSTP